MVSGTQGVTLVTPIHQVSRGWSKTGLFDTQEGLEPVAPSQIERRLLAEASQLVVEVELYIRIYYMKPMVNSRAVPPNARL